MSNIAAILARRKQASQAAQAPQQVEQAIEQANPAASNETFTPFSPTTMSAIQKNQIGQAYYIPDALDLAEGVQRTPMPASIMVKWIVREALNYKRMSALDEMGLMVNFVHYLVPFLQPYKDDLPDTPMLYTLTNPMLDRLAATMGCNKHRFAAAVYREWLALHPITD